MPDAFERGSNSLTSPSRKPEPITTHDTNPLADIPKAIYVGTGGTVILRGVDSAADTTFLNVANGTLLLVRPSHIRATGTTASGFIGLY